MLTLTSLDKPSVVFQGSIGDFYELTFMTLIAANTFYSSCETKMEDKFNAFLALVAYCNA